jgi:hypothetical protein
MGAEDGHRPDDKKPNRGGKHLQQQWNRRKLREQRKLPTPALLPLLSPVQNTVEPVSKDTWYVEAICRVAAATWYHCRMLKFKFSIQDLLIVVTLVGSGLAVSQFVLRWYGVNDRVNSSTAVLMTAVLIFGCLLLWAGIVFPFKRQ